jgi:hypothetical protein
MSHPCFCKPYLNLSKKHDETWSIHSYLTPNIEKKEEYLNVFEYAKTKPKVGPKFNCVYLFCHMLGLILVYFKIH